MSHVCEPERYPDGLGETWTCPDCGRPYESYAVKPEHWPGMTGAIPHPFGWLSRKEGD